MEFSLWCCVQLETAALLCVGLSPDGGGGGGGGRRVRKVIFVVADLSRLQLLICLWPVRTLDCPAQTTSLSSLTQMQRHPSQASQLLFLQVEHQIINI